MLMVFMAFTPAGNLKCGMFSASTVVPSDVYLVIDYSKRTEDILVFSRFACSDGLALMP